jgi:hypothetical protein
MSEIVVSRAEKNAVTAWLREGRQRPAAVSPKARLANQRLRHLIQSRRRRRLGQ